jgi:radical SAM protein with 4Fe4S-binding SPASM domain
MMTIDFYEITQQNLSKLFDRLICNHTTKLAKIALVEKSIFNTVQIETYSRCNGACEFCPVNRHIDPRPQIKMKDDMFYGIIQQLKEIDYSGSICLFSNNEPLLDERIFDFCAHVKKELPSAYNYLYTNGTLLSLPKFKTLMASLDYIWINNYIPHDKYMKSIRHPTEALHKNLKNIYEYIIEEPAEYENRVLFQIRDQNEIMTTRGGNSPNRAKICSLKSPCLHPFHQIVIRPDGKLSFCSTDALGQMTMGDLTENRLTEIWNGEQYLEFRGKMVLGRNHIEMCSRCDVRSTNMRPFEPPELPFILVKRNVLGLAQLHRQFRAKKKIYRFD